jgi:ribosomal protein S18 acetylase RimI-like enzyme
MGVALIDVTQDEYAARLPAMAVEYAQDVNRNFGVPLETAREQAAHELHTGLPHGPATEGQLLRKALDGEREVGFLWISLPGTVYPEMAWISEVHVADGLRGRGYGSQMIAAGEDDLVERGVTRVGLHVFGHNEGAQRLYDRLGYRVLSQVRARPLDPADDGLTLVPMTPEEYESHVTGLVANDPFALVRDPAVTSERARQAAGRIAPAGVATEGVLLFTAHDGGREVGWMWLTLPNAARPTIGLILHLEVDPAHRRRGLGRRMVAAAEIELARHGVPRIGVSVPGRPAALAFAGTLGMPLVSQQMVKEL